jgi:hypothetical protein
MRCFTAKSAFCAALLSAGLAWNLAGQEITVGAKELKPGDGDIQSGITIEFPLQVRQAGRYWVSVTARGENGRGYTLRVDLVTVDGLTTPPSVGLPLAGRGFAWNGYMTVTGGDPIDLTAGSYRGLVRSLGPGEIDFLEVRFHTERWG